LSGEDTAKRTRVYVDAKILNRHEKSMPHPAYVGYLVEGTGESCAKGISAEESDDAEVLAILFAMEMLEGKAGLFSIVCDHESVVSEANRDGDPKNQSQDMKTLRAKLREVSPRIVLEALLANPAHGVVTEYVNRVKAESGHTPEV
jgi:hypothetical protein